MLTKFNKCIRNIYFEVIKMLNFIKLLELWTSGCLCIWQIIKIYVLYMCVSKIDLDP